MSDEKHEIIRREAGQRGGEATRERHLPEHFREIGRKGGEETMRRHGPAHFARAGKIGGARVRDLVKRGRELEAEEKEKQ